jgi:hypothetical protein
LLKPVKSDQTITKASVDYIWEFITAVKGFVIRPLNTLLPQNMNLLFFSHCTKYLLLFSPVHKDHGAESTVMVDEDMSLALIIP